MMNPVVNLQSSVASKGSVAVPLRNSGFSINCSGQSTVSIACK